jgi:hypothetical protein
MNMSEFDKQKNNDEEPQASYTYLRSALPTDFSEDDLDFARELSELFCPEEEELPPYYAQTLLEPEDPRYQPVDTSFAHKTRARVFRSLKLRRRLFAMPRSPFAALSVMMREVFSRKALLAWTAGFVLLMMCTVAFTGPSFERGMTILLDGAKVGVLRVHHYPKTVKHAPPVFENNENAPPSQISLLAAQQQLHFRMYWPSAIPANYTLNKINLYDDPGNTWADGPVIELIYNVSTPDAKGSGEIVIREFKPLEEVLQVVQDGAAHPIALDANGNVKGIYVQGQWLPRDKMLLPTWSYLGRCEVISQQNGVVFWIAGDQNDGMNEKSLWKIAQSMQAITYTHPAMLKGDQVTILNADDTATGPFANDVLAIFSDDGTDGPYYINMSSYIAGKAPAAKNVSHAH